MWRKLNQQGLWLISLQLGVSKALVPRLISIIIDVIMLALWSLSLVTESALFNNLKEHSES